MQTKTPAHLRWHIWKPFSNTPTSLNPLWLCMNGTHQWQHVSQRSSMVSPAPPVHPLHVSAPVLHSPTEEHKLVICISIYFYCKFMEKRSWSYLNLVPSTFRTVCLPGPLYLLGGWINKRKTKKVVVEIENISINWSRLGRKYMVKCGLS